MADDARLTQSRSSMMTPAALPSVPTVRLSADGPALSAIVAGAWRMASWEMDVQARLRWIEECLALGITSFDHADIYGDYQVEPLFGEALAQMPSLRGRMQLVSKCGIRLVSTHHPAHAINSYDSARAHVLASVDRSLRALQTDRLDLLLIHRPDFLMEPEELAGTFRDLRDAGKVLHFGVSNHATSQLALLHHRFPLATNQIELSPLHLDPLSDGTLDQCLDLGLRPMLWSPLAGGRLLTSHDERPRRVRGVLEALAREHGVSLTSVAFAWSLRHPSHPVPITGTRRVDALREAVAGLGMRLTAEEWYRVWEASTGHPVP
jgi:predicted oxidoreductase